MTTVHLVGELFEGKQYYCVGCGMALLNQIRDGRWVAFHQSNYGCKYDKAEFILPTISCSLVSPITEEAQELS